MSVTAVLPVPIRFVERPDAVFASVAGMSPLVRVVRALGDAGDVVVAVAEPIFDVVCEALAGEQYSTVHVVVAESPGERLQCVAAGLRALVDGNGVVLHDIEWPIVAAHTLDRIVAALADGAVAVMPATAVTDSVKVVGADGLLAATLDRSQLRTVQYPRGFDGEALALLVRRTGSGSFDELEAALSAGMPLTVIEGDDEAVSVELPGDTDYLAALIGSRKPPAGR